MGFANIKGLRLLKSEIEVLSMTGWFIPIGYPLGVLQSDDGDPSRDSMCVRIANDFQFMTPASFDIWWQSRFFSEKELASWALAHAISDFDEIIAGLIRNRLVVPQSNFTAEAFAKSHRLLPTAVGTGDDEGTGRYFVRDHNFEPLADLSLPTYLAWSLSDGSTGLWEACKKVASAVSLDANHVLRELGTCVVDLIAVGACVIDELVVNDALV